MKEKSLNDYEELISNWTTMFVGVFINQVTWNLIAHVHLYTQNMEAEKEEVLVALES